MMRVRTIYWFKRLLKPFFIKYELLVLFTIVLGASIDIPSVLANLISATRASGNPMYFLGSAFGSSLWLVKSVVLTEIVLVLFSLKDVLAKSLVARLPRLRDLRRPA